MKFFRNFEISYVLFLIFVLYLDLVILAERRGFLMRYVRRLCALAISLALTLSAVAPARADDESVAMGVSLSFPFSL